MSSTAPVSPYGVEVKNLLETAGYDVADPRSTTPPDDDDSFEAIFIDDEPIGGVEDLRRWLARNAH